MLSLVTTEGEIGKEKVTMKYDGTVDSNVITGKVECKANSVSDESSWQAKRDPSSIIPLDVSN